MEIPQTAASTVKVASAMDHIKNNRIEYLLLLILTHFLGITDKVLNYGAGVCA